MARKKKEKIERAMKFKASDARAKFSTYAIMKASAQDEAREAGEVMKLFCEQNGVDPKAFSFVAMLRKQDDARAQNILEQVIVLFEAAGGNDQGSLFDRVAQRKARDIMAETAEKLEQNKNEMPLEEAGKKFAAAAKKNPPKPPVKTEFGDERSAVEKAEYGDKPQLPH